LPLYGAGKHQEQLDGASTDSAWDPHFWTDPIIVAHILPALAAELGRLDPAGAEEYRHNAKAFAAELESLDAELRAQLARYAGEPVVLFHPSMRYFLKAYNLELAAVVEAAPGKEPSPADLADLVNLVRTEKIRAIFSEPQLPPQAVEAIAEAAGVKVYVLDPLGKDDGARGYENMLRDNAGTLARAFQAPAE
jgi:ABC-type Zn uptake system ZnuABC Zn-binding protein ZnuA